mgnify:CR=1 FL=1
MSKVKWLIQYGFVNYKVKTVVLNTAVTIVRVQAKVMMFMPIVFSIFFFFFPAGLVLYWTVSNLLQIAQQWQINRMIDAGGKAAE